MAARIPFVLGFALYAIIFLSALVAGVIGLIAGPRHWTQQLCKWNLWATGTFLALLAGILVCFAITAIIRAEVSTTPILLFVFVSCSPLLVIFLSLLIIWLCRVSPPNR